MTDNPPEWTRFHTPRECVKAWALTEGEPRDATGIALETHVKVNETKSILADLVDEGVVERVERNGNVRFGPDRDHMHERAGHMIEDADSRADLLDGRDALVQRLDDIDDPVAERLTVHALRIIDLALKSEEAQKLT